MMKRRQYLIDKKFQLKQTFSVIGAIFILVAVIIGIIGISATTNNSRLSTITGHSSEIIKNLESVMQIQDDILETLMAWTRNPSVRPKENVIKEIAQVHYKNINSIKSDVGTIKNNIDDINKIIRYNHILLIVIVVLVLVQGAVLFFVMIRKTHKISGPIYVMSGYIKELIDGKIPQVRPLRKNDELQEFYELFTALVNSIKERGNK